MPAPRSQPPENAPLPRVVTPPSLIQVLEEEVAKIPVSRNRQVEALHDLFRRFTSERGSSSRLSYLDDPRLRSAYFRYHLPLNVARMTWALEQTIAATPTLGALPQVFDLGAGLGSASLAAWLTLPHLQGRRYALADRSRAALGVARRLLVAVSKGDAGSPLGIECRLPALPRIPGPSLILASMVLNELEGGRRGGRDVGLFLEGLERAAPPGSVLVIVEPALREPGRALLGLHDAAIRSPAWRVLAPCMHGSPCPLIPLRDRPWCHFKLRWEVPRVVREVAEPLGLEAEEPALAFLSLERVEVATPPPAAPGLARVIGDAMVVAGGKMGAYICRDGRREVLQANPPPLRGTVISLSGELPVIPESGA